MIEVDQVEYEKIFIDAKIVNMLISNIVNISFIKSSTSYFFCPSPCDPGSIKWLNWVWLNCRLPAVYGSRQLTEYHRIHQLYGKMWKLKSVIPTNTKRWAAKKRVNRKKNGEDQQISSAISHIRKKVCPEHYKKIV